MESKVFYCLELFGMPGDITLLSCFSFLCFGELLVWHTQGESRRGASIAFER
jgi:hypothetical protein